MLSCCRSSMHKLTMTSARACAKTSSGSGSVGLSMHCSKGSSCNTAARRVLLSALASHEPSDVSPAHCSQLRLPKLQAA